MNRRATAGGLLMLAALCAGCAMCQSPFDYCAPVVPPRGCPNCDFGARRGSLFHPQDETPPTTPVAPNLVEPDPLNTSALEPGELPSGESAAEVAERDADEGIVR